VNVNATVSATDGTERRRISVTADLEAILRLPTPKTSGVSDWARGQINAPTIISNLGGKVTVKLSPQSCKNAEISLYTANGKRISRNKVSASNAVNNISRPNVAKGVYLLSVRGTNGDAVTSRITHGGGGMNINVVFGADRSENLSAAPQMAKKAADAEWTITVSATEEGYKDSVYTLRPVAGTNVRQIITLRLVSGGDGSYEFVEIGGMRWMNKNLNVETADSWCYNNRPDSCAKYGRLYTWAAAKSACQLAGMRLPTRAEWDALVTAAGGSSTAGKRLKSTSGWNDYNGQNGNGTDEFGFSALPGGNRYYEGNFGNAGNTGIWWADMAGYSGGFAYGRYMYYNYDNVYEHDSDKSYAFSVRCVQDER